MRMGIRLYSSPGRCRSVSELRPNSNVNSNSHNKPPAPAEEDEDESEPEEPDQPDMHTKNENAKDKSTLDELDPKDKRKDQEVGSNQLHPDINSAENKSKESAENESNQNELDSNGFSYPRRDVSKAQVSLFAQPAILAGT